MGGATSQLRSPSTPAEVTVLSAGNVFVDLSNYRAMVADQPTELTYLEFELLRLFVNRANRIIAYEELTRSLWGSSGRRERRRLAVMVCRLRVKLAASWPHRIETVRGRGYGLLQPFAIEQSS
jgi:DNA-binding response OmpR family regulator